MIDKRTGDVYVGDFLANKFHGFGILHYGNGDAFHGLWRDGLRHGKLRLEWPLHLTHASGDGVMHYADKDGNLKQRRGAGRQLKASFMFGVPRTMILPQTMNTTTIGSSSSSGILVIPSERRNTTDTNAYRWTGK